VKTISCDAARLYGNGGMFESAELVEAALRERAAAAFVSNVYPAYSYGRPMPAAILSKDPATPQALRERYTAWNDAYSGGAECDLFFLENAVLYDRSLYTPERDAWTQIYETNRSIDRGWKTDLDPALLEHALRPNARDAHYLYFGSVGGENYAHWLVDDLTRAKALLHQTDKRWIVILDRYFPAVDHIRAASFRALGDPFDRIELIFIDRKQPHFFEQLFYVSPASYHPFLKCREALAFLGERLLPSPAQASPKKLFVGRLALWRNLLNAEEVAAFFSERSFVPVAIDWQNPLPFEEQVGLFSQAEIVVGVAGASMVNTMFCGARTRVFYLAGQGFVDPFFWDLAAVKSHEYNVCFGSPWKPEKPTFSSFTVDRQQLDELDALL
jgi:hypothetical protein